MMAEAQEAQWVYVVDGGDEEVVVPLTGGVTVTSRRLWAFADRLALETCLGIYGLGEDAVYKIPLLRSSG